MTDGKPGRPRRYAEYECLLLSLPRKGQKRPKYANSIGIFRGAHGDTVWVKIRLSQSTFFRGKHFTSALEIKLGRLTSWKWDQLEKRRDELQGRADRGDPLETIEQPHFSTWAKEWLAGAKKRIRSHSLAVIHVNNQLVPKFGNQNIDKIATRDINQWISDRLVLAKPATVKRELSTLSSILGSAVKSGLLQKNPCYGVNGITGIVSRQRFLDLSEISTLLEAANRVSTEFQDLLLWFVHSGMRKTEVLELETSDIKKLQDDQVFVQIRRSKSDKGRLIVCTKTMIEIAERQIARFPKDVKLFPITRMTLRRRWEKVRKLASLSDVTLHDLRRTHATHAAAAGVDLRTLADRIGHSDLTMLHRHYSMVVGSTSLEAAEKVQRTLKPLLN